MLAQYVVYACINGQSCISTDWDAKINGTYSLAGQANCPAIWLYTNHPNHRPFPLLFYFSFPQWACKHVSNLSSMVISKQGLLQPHSDGHPPCSVGLMFRGCLHPWLDYWGASAWPQDPLLLCGWQPSVYPAMVKYMESMEAIKDGFLPSTFCSFSMRPS